MTIYRYSLTPLEFIIESNCDNPDDALKSALMRGTSQEVGLLHYLHNNIEDYPTLNDSVELIETDTE